MFNPISNNSSCFDINSPVDLHKDVIPLIMSHLDPKDLFNVRMVCKLWNKIASTDLLPRLFPLAPLMNKQVWEEFVDLEKHGLVFEKIQEPKVTPRDYIEIKRMASEVEPNPRIYPIGIIDLPAGLTLNKLVEIADSPKKGNTAHDTHCVHRNTCERHGDAEIKQTVRVIVTNGVFNNSKNETIANQEKLVRALKCDMPELIPFVANIFLTFIRSDSNNPLELFGYSPTCTFTRCVEEDRHDRKELIGDYNPTKRATWRQPYNHEYFEYIGMGGQRKLQAIGN